VPDTSSKDPLHSFIKYFILGFTSQRDHHSGTWFIQSLVETFMNHAHDRELIDLLRVIFFPLLLKKILMKK
jgi:hypothetical protein